MAKARKILQRTKAVKNIRTISSTMEMVATASFKKSHNRVIEMQPYTDRLSVLVADILSRSNGKVDHPLLKESEDLKRDVLMVVTSSRGLCGGYNSAVLHLAIERYNQLKEAGYEVVLHVVGRKGASYLKNRGFKIDTAHPDFDSFPTYAQVGKIAQNLMADFLAERISGLEVAYTQFFSSGRFAPAIGRILPLSDIEAKQPWSPIGGEREPYELIPSAEEILRNLLPATARLRLFQSVLDSSISEQVARMSAMRAAKENADDMIKDLTLKYNRMRQSQITTELSEIIGGRAAIG